MDTRPITEEAERIVREASTALLSPEAGECLVCFVDRQVAEFGCQTTLRFSLAYRDHAAPRATALARNLGALGAYCDCELFLNAYQPVGRLWKPGHSVEGKDGYREWVDALPPELMPPCAGVRRGSTRPCVNWERLRPW